MGPKRSGRSKVSKGSEDLDKPGESNKRPRNSPQSENPRHGPGPTISIQGGQAADEPSSRYSGAPFDASNPGDRELQKATTGFAGMGISAFAPPPSGTPAWGSTLQASYHQPQTPFPSSQRGQYGVYPIGQHAQYGAYPPYQPGQYGAYPSNQPGQYNIHQSELAHLQPKSNRPNPYSNSPPATGMGTAIAAPVGPQPETRGPTKSRRSTAPQPSLGEEPQRQGREPGQQQRRGWEEAVDKKLVSLKAKQKPLAAKPVSSDWSASAHNEPGQQQSRDWKDVEDEMLVSLKRKYDKKSDKWAHIAKELSKESKQNITSDDCQRRWDAQQREMAKQESWAREEENNRLTEFVKNFDKWDTLNGWEEISEQMTLAGLHLSPENCRRRWQETLRGPAKIGDWTKAEEKLLKDFNSQHSTVELVDLLEHRLKSIRSIEHCKQQVFMLRNGPVTVSPNNTVNWTPDADQELINFNEGQRRVNHKAAAEELNKAFHTNHFTPAECEKRWTMLK